MGVCFSKKGGQRSSSTAKVPSEDLSKEKSAVKEEEKKPEAEEKKLRPVFAVAAPSLSTKKASCVGEEKEKKKAEIPGKKNSQVDGERGRKTSAGVAATGEQLPAPLRTSACTKEEVDAILIQCGRLSRSSSGKTSAETGGGGHRRYSGSKRSYDFDNDRRGEEEELQDKPVSRPSPRRRTPTRERSGSRERRVSRSPGRRSDGPVFTTSVSDKQKLQPAKMVSVPAREKGALTANGETGGGGLGTKRVSASPRSRSPANASRASNENHQAQSLSRNSSRKADQSPYRRNPLTEVEDNSYRNQNGSNTGMFQKSRNVDEGTRKHICSSDQKSSSHVNISSKQQLQQKTKRDMMEESNQVIDAKVASIGAESLNPISLTRTRSSRRSSRDFDNPGFNPITSYASLLFEDIQNQQQQQHIAFSLPACISKACSILDAVADLNSSCSDRRSYEADQSKNMSSKNGGFAARGLMMRREPFIESELEVKDDLMEPSLHKYVTVRQKGVEDMDPQESAGSNSFLGQPLGSSLWEMNSIDSTCGTSMTDSGKEVVEVEDEVGNAGNQQQQQRSGGAAASGRKSPMRKEFDQQQVVQQQGGGGGHGVGGGNGFNKVVGRAFSLPVSAATY